jgi:hypothetical protein
MRKFLLVLFLVLPFAGPATAADTVPTDIQMPGTQPQEIGNLESPDKCDNCHGGYNLSVEPAYNWRGSMMAQAGRDPIFWATLAIAEQDFDGAGDLCLRCHSTGGWLAGRSTPTDGSGLAAGDADGVECDYCHKLTNPDDKEHQGVMNGAFVANDPAQGWYGSGMSSLWGGSDKLGPYNDAEARHQFMQSDFHREPEFCGTCHDVSNPAVGNVAHNGGVLPNATAPEASGVLGGAVDGKAAFNNPPFAYGIVERTFSEHMSSPLSTMAVNEYPGSELPAGGAFQALYLAATADETQSADYANPPRTRTYTCQTCHMRPVSGTGANKRGVPVRHDLPLHDMTGGNYWMADAIQWLDSQGRLRLGGGLTGEQIAAMADGAFRAREQLQLAATLDVHDAGGGTVEVKITNHTGHKLISGYPEGRRMWLNVKWYDGDGGLLREDGEYGDMYVTLDGQSTRVRSILDLDDPNLFIFEAHMGMTQEWAAQLVSLDYPTDMGLSYDRLGGQRDKTLGELAAGAYGDATSTFHFVLNNTVKSDNRIPPFEMDYQKAKQRNATPWPETQYLDSDTGKYKHYAELYLTPPSGAVSATIDLLYQPTSWEYIQFLYEANDGSVAFLANEGRNMLDAWLATGMAEPMVMESATWQKAGEPEPDPCTGTPIPTLLNADPGNGTVALDWSAVVGGTAYSVYYDQSDKSQPLTLEPLDCQAVNCLTYTDSGLINGQSYCYKVTSEVDGCTSDFSNVLCATPQNPGQTSTASVSIVDTGRIVRVGKGKHATEEYQSTAVFAAGDEVIVRLLVTDESGAAISGATATLSVSGPESATLTSGASDSGGNAEAGWSTRADSRKKSGTLPGSYTLRVTGLGAAGYDWDNLPDSVQITIQ